MTATQRLEHFSTAARVLLERNSKTVFPVTNDRPKGEKRRKIFVDETDRIDEDKFTTLKRVHPSTKNMSNFTEGSVSESVQGCFGLNADTALEHVLRVLALSSMPSESIRTDLETGISMQSALQNVSPDDAAVDKSDAPRENSSGDIRSRDAATDEKLDDVEASGHPNTQGPEESTHDRREESTLDEAAQKRLDVFPSWQTIDSFRDATEDEQASFPYIFKEFSSYMESLDCAITTSTRKTYATYLQKVVRLDMKAPEVMATSAYREAVKHTLENSYSGSAMSAAVTYFGKFWESRAGKPIPRSQENVVIHRKQRIQPEDGDDSAEARSKENLPEGWHVHEHKSKGSITCGWSSPRRHFYFSKKELDIRLGRGKVCNFTTPQKKPIPDSIEESASKQPPQPSQPLGDLLGTLASDERATSKDREILPSVLATFRRYLSDQFDGEKRQTTQDRYVFQVFKLFSSTDRKLEVLTSTQFIDLVRNSEEHKRSHGTLAGALTCFAKFWTTNGGYEGKFDKASRDDLNLALNVKPMLADCGGICGYNLPGGDICRKPKQKCETCGTVTGCFKHADHSPVECREIFWCKHSLDGTRAKTVKDYFGGVSATKG